MRKTVAALAGLIIMGSSFAQNQNIHPASTEYQWPADTLVRQKLEQWRDQKFGMIIHWGLYAVPGMIESWALCSEDWITRDSNQSYADFKNWYWGLKKDFNPVQFDPDQWAAAAKKAGMRYGIKLLATGSNCKFVTKGDKVIVTIPPALQKRLASQPALAFSINK